MTCVGRKTRAMERSECRPFSRVCEPSARQWLGVSPLLEQPLSLAPQTLRASDRRSGPYASLRSRLEACSRLTGRPRRPSEGHGRVSSRVQRSLLGARRSGSDAGEET